MIYRFAASAVVSVFFLTYNAQAISKWDFDGCNSEQQLQITTAIFEAQNQARDVMFVNDQNRYAYLDFFGPQNANAMPAVMRDTISAVAGDNFAIKSYCPSTTDQQMKDRCRREMNEGSFGDVAGSKDGDLAITFMFCDNFFRLKGFKERVDEIMTDTAWWQHYDLGNFFRNQATSVLHELFHLSSSPTQINDIWMQVPDKGASPYIGAYGPLAARLLARLSNTKAHWPSLNANSYALFALAARLSSKDSINIYPFLPRADGFPIIPGSRVTVSGLVTTNEKEWTFNGASYNASTFHQRYTQMSAPKVDSGTKHGYIADVTKSTWITDDEMDKNAYINIRDKYAEDYLTWASMHNYHEQGDTIPVSSDPPRGGTPSGQVAPVCASEHDDGTKYLEFDRNEVWAKLNDNCNQKDLPWDVLLAPAILAGNGKSIDGKSKVERFTWAYPDIGKNKDRLELIMEVSSECSIPIMVRDAFTGKNDDEKRKDCVRKYEEIIDRCDKDKPKYGGALTQNCVTFRAVVIPADKQAPYDHGVFHCEQTSPLVDPGSPNDNRFCSCAFEKMPKAKAVFCKPQDGCHTGFAAAKDLKFDNDMFEMQRQGEYCPYI